MSIRLTLCGSNVCLGRNLITVFFTVNSPAKKFFIRGSSRPRGRTRLERLSHTAKAAARAPACKVDKKKALLFSCIVRAHRRARHARAMPRTHPPTALAGTATAPAPGENFFRPGAFRGIASGEMRKLFHPRARRGDHFARRARTPRGWRRLRVGHRFADRDALFAASASASARPPGSRRSDPEAKKNGRFRGRFFAVALTSVKGQ
ncbi:MAG TPA: hypothetical protein VD865_09175 [Stenotrophomonas sp.]|nr:hypothetical protein [Stenotrophomonas sp.]